MDKKSFSLIKIYKYIIMKIKTILAIRTNKSFKL